MRQLTNGIRALFRRRIADEELDAELHAFLETAVDEKMRSGMSQGYGTDRRAAFVERFVDRASTLPGVTSVAAANILPLGGEMYGATLTSNNGASSSRVERGARVAEVFRDARATDHARAGIHPG